MPSDICLSATLLHPDASRTVIRPFTPEDPPAFADPDRPRAVRILDRIRTMDRSRVSETLALLTAPMTERHPKWEALMRRRYAELPAGDGDRLDPERQVLAAAYFSAEYAFESAALFNPSIVPHPDQSGLAADTIRFVMALRGIGEGHVSSATFRTGTWGPGGAVTIDPPSRHGVPPRIEWTGRDGDDEVVRLVCADSEAVSETVLFPVTPSQRQGIEDVRLVHFREDDGTERHLGTYTAFSGADARPELLIVQDFRTFEMRPLRGKAAVNKGMALFPRRIGGRYAMLGRQDNENLFLMRSDDLHVWEEAEKILSPEYWWEMVQIGNCGSPIEIDEGWLVLTHGVGVVRGYCIGACLLDKDDPSRVLGRTPEPILTPTPEERGGYVPNVVYSCGGLVHDRTLLLPYGIADSYTAFASMPVDAVLARMR